MPPKKKQADGETHADREASHEASRLRKRASPALLQSQPPSQTSDIPSSLRKSDGADIIKRNASRKKNYIFVFPGTLSLPTAGGKVGSLAALDTRNPILNIEFPSGTLRLFGTLVFPQNALISVKPAKTALQVLDVFETMIVFSEWRWVGDLSSNPGGVPVPLPDELKISEENFGGSDIGKRKRPEQLAEAVDISSDRGSSELAESDQEAWEGVEAESDAVAVRSNPRRKGRVVNYSQLDGDGSGDPMASGEDSEENVSNEKRRKRGIDNMDNMDDSVQIVEDMAGGEGPDMNNGRKSREKRRKLSSSLDERRKVTSSESSDGVQIVEEEQGVVKEIKETRTSRRTKARKTYWHESGDEYDDNDEVDQDDDFAIDTDDGDVDL